MSRGGQAGVDPAGAVPKIRIREIWGDRRVRMVIVVIFVVMLGFGIIAPVLPLYARSFGVGYEAVGLLVSAFAMTRLMFDLVAGPLIDRYGERLCASWGLFVVGVSSFLAGIAPNFPLVVVFRGAGGAGSAVLFAALYSYLLRVVPKDRMGRTLSLFYGAFNIGVVAGGPLGGLIAEVLGLRAPLFFYSGLLFLSGAMYLRLVPDAPAGSDGDASDPGRRGATLPAVGRLLRDRTFMTVVFVNFAYLWFVAAVLDTLIPLFGKDELGLSAVGVGGAFAVAIAAEFAVLYHAGSVADRRGRKAVLVPALLGLCAAIGVLGWATDPLAFFLLMGVLGVASGYAGVPPGAMLSDVTPGERSGTAVGTFRFAGDLGFVLGPLLAGGIAETLGFVPAFLVAAVPPAAGALLVLRIQETLRRERSPASTPSTGGSSGTGS